MKKAILFFAFILFVVSCSKNNEDNSYEEINDLVSTEAALKSLKTSIIEFKNSSNLSESSKSSNLSFNNVRQADMEEVLEASIILIKSYGITESEIIEDFGSLENPGIIEASLAIAQIEDNADYGVQWVDVDTGESLLTGEPFQITDDGFSSKNSSFKSDVYDCTLQAIGVTAVLELMDAGIKKMTKSAVKKVLKKVATKYLGWVGAAIAVYEFGDCMEWW